MKKVDSHEYEKMKHALYEYHHCMNEAAANLRRIASECQDALSDDGSWHKSLESRVESIAVQWLQVADEAINIANTMLEVFE